MSCFEQRKPDNPGLCLGHKNNSRSISPTSVHKILAEIVT